VTYPEPLPQDSQLFELANCVITPHIAGDDRSTRKELYEMSRVNLMNGLNGKQLTHQIGN